MSKMKKSTRRTLIITVSVVVVVVLAFVVAALVTYDERPGTPIVVSGLENLKSLGE